MSFGGRILLELLIQIRRVKRFKELKVPNYTVRAAFLSLSNGSSPDRTSKSRELAMDDAMFTIATADFLCIGMQDSKRNKKRMF